MTKATSCRYRRETIISRFITLLHQLPYRIFPLYTDHSTHYEFRVSHMAEFHTVFSIYVLNAHSTLLRNSGYHMNLHITNKAAVCYSKTTRCRDSKNHKVGQGGVHVRHYVCMTVQNTMRNSLFVPKKWRQSNRRGR